MQSLAGKTVLITGAGCGIGQLMARAAAAEKANLALIDINAANLKAVETELQQFSGQVAAFTCDISDRKAVAAVSQTIKDRFGHVDVLMFNPILKPEQVAGAVMMAIRKDKPYVIMPFVMIQFMSLLKVVIPTGLFDWILHVTGGSRAMSSFKGR